MAISLPKKSRKQKARAAVRRKGVVPAIDWSDSMNLSGEEFHKKNRKAVDELYQNVKHSDLLNYVYQWMKKNDYSADDIKCAKASNYTNVSASIIAKLLLDGIPDFHQGHADYWDSLQGTMGQLKPRSEYLKRSIEESIKTGRPLVEQKEAEEAKKKAALGNVYKPTIQQVMQETAKYMAEGLDKIVDEFIETQDPSVVKKFDAFAVLNKVEAKANHARIIRTFYQGCYDELFEVNNMPSISQRKKLSEKEQDLLDQLEEGYDHYSTAQKKAALDLYKKIMNACDMIITSQKATRKPRKVKEKSADQLVSKLKLKQADTDHGIASVSPTSLIGSVCAVVFNTKNRKLGIYVASDSDGFGVKGTTLQRYDEEQSIQKTLRKPTEVLSKLKKTTKAKTLKEFSYLKTTETKLNGRFNEETVLLAVFK